MPCEVSPSIIIMIRRRRMSSATPMGGDDVVRRDRDAAADMIHRIGDAPGGAPFVQMFHKGGIGGPILGVGPNTAVAATDTFQAGAGV